MVEEIKDKRDKVCITCERYIRCNSLDKSRGMACSEYEKKGKGKKENPVKIVRFKDGDMLCAGGTEEEVRKEMKEKYPEKEIAVIA